MAKIGQRMTSFESGETFVFLQTAESTGGQKLVVDMICEPGGGAKGAPIHLHPIQTEKFYIHQGMCEFTLNGYTFLAYPGETVLVPAGAPHTWRNPNTDDKLLFRVELEPAGGMEHIFENMTALSQMGRLTPEGGVPLLAMARVLNRYPDNLYIAHIPKWMQKFGIKMMAFIARLLGYPLMYNYEDAVQWRARRSTLIGISSAD